MASALLHAVAGAATAGWAWDGTGLETDQAAREEYVDSHRGVWTATWLLWALAGGSFVAFVLAWAPRTFPGRLAGACVSAAWAIDLVGDAIWIAFVPNATGSLRLAAEAMATAASGLFANSLYTAAGALTVWAAFRQGTLPVRLAILSVPSWVSGAGLTAGALIEAPLIIATFTACLLLALVPWLAALGWWAWRES